MSTDYKRLLTITIYNSHYLKDVMYNAKKRNNSALTNRNKQGDHNNPAFEIPHTVFPNPNVLNFTKSKQINV